MAKFPKTFWAANTVELFERAAYYSVASFVVIYFHEVLGMSPTFSTFLNGTILWGLIYFLPPLSGTLADRFGFKRSLSITFILLFFGYLTVGTVKNFWHGPDYALPVVAGIVLIGIGGSFVKPCISGTVQKTSGANAALGFAIFYMTINVGSMMGRIVSYFVRIKYGIPAIFSYVATTFAFLGLLVIFFIYREPGYSGGGEGKYRPKSLGEALVGMFTVLRNLKFVFFLVVIGLFWIIYVQIYNLIPLFLRKIDPDAPVELYTLVNPVSIVLLQLLVARLSRKWSSLKAIMVGIGITIAGMLVNVVPFVLKMNPKGQIDLGAFKVPLAGAFMLLSIFSMALGEMFASPRIYQYIGAIAPRGQEGLYLGYANLPLALGTIVGAPLGGMLFETFIEKPQALGYPMEAAVMWVAVAAMGVASLLGVFLYDRFLVSGK